LEGSKLRLWTRFRCLFDTHKYEILTHRGFCVRTNIDIDDRLMRQAMRRSGAPTKKAAVEAGLRLLAETHAQGSIRRLRGKVAWDGDLDQSRLTRLRE
jgi:Arc/MetJ family transcription regulator